MNRRTFLQWASSVSFLAASPVSSPAPAKHSITTKPIIKTNEVIPAIGMGTWLTFDIPPDSPQRTDRIEVLKAFFESGGTLIDSSPMYGHAEETVGYCLQQMAHESPLFAASKIWSPIANIGIQQMGNSESLWKVKPMDLMQIHNLVAWKKHLPMLREWKRQGRIRYLGVTTSHGRRHEDLEQLLKQEQFDFVQLTYNIDDDRTEKRLLPLAQDLGINVIANRPFQRGGLIDRYKDKPLPALATELGCATWAQYFLLHTISHPAITCAIPATTRVDHMKENMATLKLPLPDQSTRNEMRKVFHQTG